MRAARLLALAALALPAAGCESPQIRKVTDEVGALFQSNRGEADLNAGLKEYEDGNYQEAEARLQAAQGAGLRNKSDQVKAHKYLAFTYCVTAREAKCRDQFRKALDIDPAFDLTAAEAGHPTWGPAFRSVKGKKP